MNTIVLKASNPGMFTTPNINWLYLVGFPLIAITSGYYTYLNPGYFFLILTLDLWLLGYHHLISTFSRLAFDVSSMKENWFFLLPLPVIVIAGVSASYSLGGEVLVASVYIYWQWWHYSRQSEGISKAYGMKSENKAVINHPLNRAVFYLVPLICFLWMVSRDDQMFLGMNFFHIYLPETLRLSLLYVSIGITVAWLTNAVRLYHQRQITLYYLIYMISHFSIYYIAYVHITHLNSGWLVINIWHNMQYIGIVWLFNNNRFKDGVDTSHFLISYLSQNGRFIMYILVFLTLTFAFYGIMDEVTTHYIELTGLPLILLVYATLNFHHYVVDSKIWKLRKSKVSENLS